MGEAGVHKKIEFTSWNIPDPKLSKNPTKTFESLSDAQQQALSIYAGNWMRDFSQVYVPSVFENVKKMPRVMGDILSPPIGPLGAESLIGSILRSVAIQDFDTQIPQKVMTDQNIGVYVPQEHMDNPAGLTLDDDLLVRTNSNPKSGQKGHYVIASQSKPNFRENTLNAEAFDKSLQIENPFLYNVSPSGMNYFVFNTSEWIKHQFKKSKNSSDVDLARMFFGSGLHGIEDYFAHSNFIEIALNLILKNSSKYGLSSEFKKIKKFDSDRIVDTLYDKGKKDHITTGTFASGLDTGVSIAYVFLAKMPLLFDAIDKGVDILLDRKLDKILEIVSKKKTLEERRKEFEKLIKKYQINYKGAHVLKILLDGMDGAKIKVPTFETLKLPKDLQVTVPCTHLKVPHSNGDTVTVPCTHLKVPHSNGDTVTVPCTHLKVPHSNGDTVTVPCTHKTVKHPNGHLKFGVRVPCVHFKLKHSNGHQKKVPCTHTPVPRHPNGHQKKVPCTHTPVPRHPNGHQKKVPCTHTPVPRHPNGDKIKLSQSNYGKFKNSLLGSKIPIGIKYDSPSNAFKIFQELNQTGHKVWAHYVTIQDFLDSVDLSKQAKLWLTSKWDDVTLEYREILRNHMKMIFVLSLQLLIPGIPIEGIKEKDGYKIKGDYTTALKLVKKGIDLAEINTFMFSKDAVKKDDRYLPPTHSEISKDHPKKNIQEKSRKYHLHGSLFYDIHFLLAKHAVQHITVEMIKYSKHKPLIEHRISKKQIQKFSSINKNAEKLFSEITEESKITGRKTYNETGTLLFEIVDYYLSHPSKTKWWEKIISDYLNNHSKQVIDDINHRNKTRVNRSDGSLTKKNPTKIRTSVNHKSKKFIRNNMMRQSIKSYKKFKR